MAYVYDFIFYYLALDNQSLNLSLRKTVSPAQHPLVSFLEFLLLDMGLFEIPPFRVTICFCLVPVQVMFRQLFDNSYFNEQEFETHNGLIISMKTKDDYFS